MKGARIKVKKRAVLLLKTLSLFIVVCTALAQAQTPGVAAYPARPVRLVVGFTAGGAADIVGRIIAQKLSEATGQSFFVDNRPGASATIAAELVAKAHASREQGSRLRDANVREQGESAVG